MTTITKGMRVNTIKGDRMRAQLAVVQDLPESLTRYKRWVDSTGERTGSMVPHDSGGWVSFGMLLKRINEITGKRVPELEQEGKA